MKTLQIKLSEYDYDKVSRIKVKSGMTWPAFLRAAASAYETKDRCKDDGR